MEWYTGTIGNITVNTQARDDGRNDHFSDEMVHLIGLNLIFYKESNNWFKAPGYRYRWHSTWIRNLGGAYENLMLAPGFSGYRNRHEALAYQETILQENAQAARRRVEERPIRTPQPGPRLDFQALTIDDTLDTIMEPIPEIQMEPKPTKKSVRQNVNINGFTFSILEDEKPSPENIQVTPTVKSANTLLQISRELFITSSGFNTDSIGEGITLILWNKITGKRVQIKVD